MDMDTFLKAIPKVSLHLHLMGSVQAPTAVDLCNKHNVPLPDYDEPEDLYDYPDIYKFLHMYDNTSLGVIDREDFERICYETLTEAAEHNVRYREMFFNPTAHMAAGVDYETCVDGLIDGINAARTDHGIECRLIAAINRMETPELGVSMVETLLDHPRSEVIGIGMDYAEAEYPPERFWKAYRMAEQAGLHLTAHQSEDAPPRNIETCLDLLNCERVDHGYHVVESEAIMRRCRDEGVVFTCTPVVRQPGCTSTTTSTITPSGRCASSASRSAWTATTRPCSRPIPPRTTSWPTTTWASRWRTSASACSTASTAPWLGEPEKRTMRRQWAHRVRRAGRPARLTSTTRPNPNGPERH